MNHRDVSFDGFVIAAVVKLLHFEFEPIQIAQSLL